ncbi:hypothetical protein IWW45_008529, partial [Coemansia sp. RSA 485]
MAGSNSIIKIYKLCSSFGKPKQITSKEPIEFVLEDGTAEQLHDLIEDKWGVLPEDQEFVKLE